MRTFLLLAALPSPLWAQATWEPFRRIELSPGIEVAQSNTAGANVGIVWTDAGPVLIDSNVFPTVAEQLARDLEAQAGRPVQAIINTHWHIDHVHGNAAVARIAGPDLEIFAHRTAGRGMLDRAPIQLQLWPEFFGGHIADLERRAGQGAAIADELDAKRRLAAELSQAEIREPTTTFSDSAAIDIGGRRIDVYHFGRGHTAGDVVVFDRESGTAFVGDLLVGASRYPVEHVEALERFLELPIRTVVPGHGPPEQGAGSAERLLDELRTIIDAVEAGLEEGRSPDAIVTGLPPIEGLFDAGGIARRAYDALTLFETGTFVSHGVELSYAIDFPEGDGPFPGIVLGHGSGERVKQEQVQVAAHLVARGFAVLRYDKRGVGESGGVYTGINLANSDTVLALLADDMVAAARHLADDPRIRPRRIGLYGGSQAGWIIPLVLVKAPEVEFGIVLVGPVVSVGLEGTYSRLAERTSTPLEEVYRRFDPADDPGGFDPIPVLGRVMQPVLWLMGGHDRSLPTRTSVENMDRLIDEGGRYTLEVFPTATHSLRDSETGDIVDYWATIDRWLAVEWLEAGR